MMLLANKDLQLALTLSLLEYYGVKSELAVLANGKQCKLSFYASLNTFISLRNLWLKPPVD